MSLWIDFLVMVLMAIIAIAVMSIIFIYLDKCIRSIKKTGNQVWFTCIATVALWVVLAVVMNAVAC